MQFGAMAGTATTGVQITDHLERFYLLTKI